VVTFWYIVVAVFWSGFVILEGFDFGVGALHAVVGRTEAERRLAVNSVGPFWDGNEVWLIVAGAAIFAAFPQWYATMFSALYLALVVVLVALMARGVSFEYRAKVEGTRWAASWQWAMTVSSLALPLLIGVALGDLVHGLPIDQAHQFTGSFWTLLQPYGLWTGVTLLALSLLSGSTFLALRTSGAVSSRAAAIAPYAGWSAAALLTGLIVWTHVLSGHVHVPTLVDVAALLAVFGAAWASTQRAQGWAFSAACAGAGLTVAMLFVNLYPDVLVSTTNPAYSLTAAGTASPPYTLKVMTIVAVAVVPFVLAYQAWNFWVFRRRLVGPPGPGTSSAEPEAAAPGTTATATPPPA
jgi:cytochrome d ubiquinol oxidase subunit II